MGHKEKAMKATGICGAMLMTLLAGACQQHAAAPAAAGPGANADGFRDSFAVDKRVLRPTGRSEYFRLEPGAVSTFKEGRTVLTIRVLNETKLVDGVKTAVVEEREETGGTPKEISRNYFAIDPATGDVYYFGEDVDMYKGGKVSGHEGSWLAGANGARFGLAMPGHPKVGDRFQQEIAPGSAMDRVEIVSISERVKTPAGTFERCVHVKETTPLEKDAGHKWYAPGMGLVKDDEMELVSHTP